MSIRAYMSTLQLSSLTVSSKSFHQHPKAQGVDMETVVPIHPRKHCLRCAQRKLNCRGLGPGEGSCKQCSKASVESTAVVGCVWEYNDCDLDKRTRSQLSDCGEDRTPDDLKRIKKAEVAADDAKFTFLCPYFLRDSEKWRSVHSCSGDGWNKLHRLKEHIYRKHKQLPYCWRCFLTFESEVKLREHLRNDSKDICEVVKPPLKAPDGYNDAQEKDLRARTGAEKTDIEKWKDMWVILFPDDSECDIVDPQEFFSNRYDDRFQLVVGKLRTLALRPPKSTTVEVIQKEILEIIQEEEPGSSLPLPTAQEPHPESISSSIVLASNNPFLPRKRKTDPQALEPSPSLSFQSQVTDETTAFLPSPSAGHSFSTPGSQHWSQERPCDKWYREHQEAQRATTSTAASPGLLEQQSQHGSLYTIRHDERSQDAVMSAYQMSHNWPTNSSFQPASVTLGCLGTNEGDLNSTSPSFYRGAQSQPISQYHNYPIHDHIEDTRLGWPLSSTSTMPGLWNN